MNSLYSVCLYKIVDDSSIIINNRYVPYTIRKDLEFAKKEKIYINHLKRGLVRLKDIDRNFHTVKVCIEAVNQNGWALKDVHKQTPEICLKAVNQTGYALQYVLDQTNQICTEAVNREGLALKFVKKQTPEICLLAIKQNALALQYV
jgi:hypothetical protein